MRGVSDLIKTHSNCINQGMFDINFLPYHLEQIRFLQQERLVHLIVMLFVIFTALFFFSLFFLFNNILFLVVFAILLILSVFYIVHYFKLENTVIEWYFIYNEHYIKNR